MSIQFDTQRLLSESTEQNVVFVVKNDKLDDTLNANFSSDLDYNDKDQYSLDTETYEKFVDLAMSLGYDEGEDFEVISDLEEEGSTTGGAGGYLPSLHASPKKYKGPELEQKKSYMQKKWGWKEAPSIPNRKSKVIDYKQLFEREIKKGVDAKGKEVKIGDDVKVLLFKDGTGTIVGFDKDQIFVNVHKGGGSTYERENFPLFSKNIEKKEKDEKKKSEKDSDMKKQPVKESIEDLNIDDRVVYKGQTGTIVDIAKSFIVVEMDRDGKKYSIHASDLEKIGDSDLDDEIEDVQYKTSNAEDYLEDLYESYSKFVKETKTRSKSQQFYEAARQVDKKLREINKILEYTSKLKTELFEDGHCEDCGRRMNKIMEKITKNIAEAYKKTKNIK